jgi:tryptophan-rich sensory protein
MSKQVLGFIGWFAITAAAGAIGAAASLDAATFYLGLARPSWAPPPGVFGPVWSVLYLLMAIAAWLVWRNGGFAARRTALILYVVQLAANALWSVLFFGKHQGALAFADVIVLWVLIVATIVLFSRASKVAAALLVPYLLWVSFASALNYSVWQLNPAALGGS